MRPCPRATIARVPGREHRSTAAHVPHVLSEPARRRWDFSAAALMTRVVSRRGIRLYTSLRLERNEWRGLGHLQRGVERQRNVSSHLSLKRFAEVFVRMCEAGPRGIVRHRSSDERMKGWQTPARARARQRGVGGRRKWARERANSNSMSCFALFIDLRLSPVRNRQ